MKHAYLGVLISSVAGGARVSCIVKGAPADSAGLKVGDVITKFGGSTIATANTLTAAVTGAHPDEKVTLSVRRDGTTKQFSVTLGTQPSAVSKSCAP